MKQWMAMAFCACAALPMAAQYPAKAPWAQYMSANEAAEIALARTAAPAAISAKATVLTLTDHGYVKAVDGSNGFTCLVIRAWAKPTDDPEFWNPKLRAPHCLNDAAAKTYLPIVLFKTKLVLAGKSAAEIGAAEKAAFARKQLPSLAPEAVAYMMSKQQYLGDQDKGWHPHVMWYVPGDATKQWGANVEGSPVYAGFVPEDHMTVVMMTAAKWSDGTPAGH